MIPMTFFFKFQSVRILAFAFGGSAFFENRLYRRQQCIYPIT